jgi:hypothetical protein
MRPGRLERATRRLDDVDKTKISCAAVRRTACRCSCGVGGPIRTRGPRVNPGGASLVGALSCYVRRSAGPLPRASDLRTLPLGVAVQLARTISFSADAAAAKSDLVRRSAVIKDPGPRFLPQMRRASVGSGPEYPPGHFCRSLIPRPPGGSCPPGAARCGAAKRRSSVR